MITVAATDGFDNLAPFSNRGAAGVAVAAPGSEVLTTQAGGDYCVVSGTSAAAPLVAGIAGLVRTAQPRARAEAVRAAVVGGARWVEGLAGKVSSGGVADAAGALAAARGNPYAGGGSGDGRGSGNGQGNGQGNGGGPYVPPALRHDNDAGRANDKQGRFDAPPDPVRGAPGANLPDLNRSRKVRKSPTVPPPSETIKADLMCADCDPSGGGGGGSSYPNDPYFGTARTLHVNDVGEVG